MSDPVTNVEIEDVLSSIRRLVSDEARSPLRAPKPAEGDVEERSEVSENKPKILRRAEESTASEQSAAPALILTPALRVAQELEEDAPQEEAAEAPDPLILENASAEPEPEAQAAEEVAGADHEHSHHDTLVQGIAEPETEDADAQDHAQADTQDEPADAEAAEVQEQAPQEATEPDEHEDAAEADTQPTIELAAETEAEEAEASGGEEPRSIEDKIAALEALINRSAAEEFEPDGAEDGANAAHGGEALPWEDSDRRREETVSYPEPESASEEAQFDEGMSAFQRAHEAAASAAVSELQADAAETLLGNEDVAAVLDEEALRDMVAEIVRQELQGPLGERITRNVRKLVRREIYRALAANELD